MTPAVDADRHDHVRSPVDVLRLVLAAVILVAGVVSSNLFDSTLLGLSDDIDSSLSGIPGWVRNLPATGLAVAVLAAVAASVLWAAVTTRWRRLALLVTAFAAAAALSIAIGGMILSILDEPVRRAFDVGGPILRYRDGAGRIHPGDPLLAGGIAMLGIGSSYLRRTTSRRIAALLAGYAAISVMAVGVPAVGLLADVGAGLLVASLLLLAFGRHDLAPHAHQITSALDSIGVGVDELAPLSVDARGSTPWVGTRSGCSPVFVKVLGRNERSADLMFRVYRWLRLRKTGDHKPFVSLKRAVEHEALVALQAAALGIRTPRILGVAEVGVDGMLIAYESIDARSADLVDEIDDATLDAIWGMVHELHRTRIAHRDLRLANILIEPDGTPWLIDFGFSELAASDQLLGTDVAELLASTAAVVGAEGAVAAAHRTSGVEELERAMLWLQPLAMSTATREAIGGEKGLEPIRSLLVEQCGLQPEEPVKLERIDGKALFVIATLALSVYFLAPQLADIDNIWAQVRTASPAWMVAAVALSLLTYVAATASLLGAIPVRLRFLPALAAQMASSFANRVTPAKVGGVATNIRYFQRHGVPTAVGVTAVGLNAIAGLMTHVALTFTFLLLASGTDTSTELPIPSPAVVGVALGALAAIAALTWAVPITRRLMRLHVVPQLIAGARSIRQIAKSPSRLALLFGGSAVITLAYLAAMIASLEAFGSTASLPLVGLLFLTASAVANAAPTPGGIGAVEAALIAVFSTVEAAEVVVPAVFLYRFVTFWIPILPGWAALTWLRRTDNI